MSILYKNKTAIRNILIIATLVLLAVVFLPKAFAVKPVETGPQPKFFVCKYVGTPGQNETLQTGQNPISVNGNALPDGTAIGDSFADAQGRSYVVAEDTGQDEPECPTDEEPVDVCENIEGNQATVPEGLELDENGNCNEPEITTDVCPNIEGDQAEVPDGYVLKDSGCEEVVIENPPEENETPAPDGTPSGQNQPVRRK